MLNAAPSPALAANNRAVILNDFAAKFPTQWNSEFFCCVNRETGNAEQGTVRGQSGNSGIQTMGS